MDDLTDRLGAKRASMFILVQEAFKKLLTGPEWHTGTDLFGKYYQGARWGYMVVRRLRRDGLVEERNAFGTGILMKGNRKLRDLLEDQERMIAFIWPSLDEELPSAPPGPGPRLVAEPDPADPEPEEEEELPMAIGSSAPPTDRELLESLLKLMSVGVQNIVYMRAKVDALVARTEALSAEITALKKAWE